MGEHISVCYLSHLLGVFLVSVISFRTFSRLVKSISISITLYIYMYTRVVTVSYVSTGFERRQTCCVFNIIVMKKANIRNRYNQVPHLTQDTTLESDKNTRKQHTYPTLCGYASSFSELCSNILTIQKMSKRQVVPILIFII